MPELFLPINGGPRAIAQMPDPAIRTKIAKFWVFQKTFFDRLVVKRPKMRSISVGNIF
jgi:hypothetical protein